MRIRNRPHTLESLKELTVTNNNGCWIWQGTKRSNGYGVTVYKGTQTTTHRVMYQVVNGSLLGEGLEIDHTCNTRDCINPEHLEAVSHKENMARGLARRQTCRNGHEWDDTNTYVKEVKRKQGGTRMARYCRVCRANNQRDLRNRADLVGLNNKGGLVK